MTHFCLDARTATDHFPGIGRYVFNLLRTLPPQLEEEEKLTVLWHPGQPSPWDLSRLQNDSLRLLATPVSPFSIRQQWKLPDLLASLEVDLYHSAYYLMPYWTGRTTVLTVHDLIPMTHPRHVSLKARLFFRAAMVLALRTSRQIITVSEATLAELKGHFGNSVPATAIPLAADPCFFPQSSEEIERVRRKYGLFSRFVLFVGTNKPHKNLKRLLEAWETVRAEQPPGDPVELVIAGPWDARYADIKTVARQTERVRILGPVSDQDLPALYSAAEIFVHPSLCEGFGLPVLEALACATAVTCSRIPSLVEIAGETALFFDPRDPRAIARALLTLLEDGEKRRQLETEGRRRSQSFSWDHTARETLRVYRAILRG